MPDPEIRVVVKGFIADLRTALRAGRSEVRSFSRDVEKENKSLVRSNRDVHRSFMDIDGAIGKVNRSFSLLRNVVGLIKWPALISAVGLATQVIGQLAAGVVGLIGSLKDLSGLLIAYPSLLGAVGQALVTVKLGFGEVGQALSGNEQAYKRLNEQQKQFVRFVNRELKPAMKDLKQVAGEGLFPGLRRGSRAALGNLDVFKGIIGGTAEELGRLAEQAGKLLGSKAFGRDLAKVGEQNRKAIGAMGDSVIDLTRALSIMLVEAEPLLRFIRQGIRDFGEWARESARAGRESGALREFFASTRDTLRVLLPLLRDFSMAILNLTNLGKPLGDSLLRSLRDSAKEFRQWTESARGKNDIADYFRKAEPGIRALGTLLVDLVKMFTRLSGREGAAKMIRQLDDELLPAIEKLIGGMTEAFGPTMIDLVVSLAKTLATLSGPTGALIVIADTLKVISDLIRVIFNAPGVGRFASQMLQVAAAWKVLKFTGAVDAARTLLRLWQGIAASSAATAAATGAAGVGAGVGAGLGAGAAAGAGSKVIYGPKGEILSTGAAAAAAGGGKLAGLRGLAMTAGKAGAIGAGISALIGFLTTAGGIGNKLQGAGSNLTLGAIPMPKTPEERAATRQRNTSRFARQALAGRSLGRNAPDEVRAVGRGGMMRVPNESKRDWDDLTKRQRRAVQGVIDYRKEVRTLGLSTEKLKLLVRPGEAIKNLKLLKAGFQQLRIGAISDVKELRAQVETNVRTITSTLGTRTEAGMDAMVRNFRLGLKNIKTLMRSGQLNVKEATTEVERLLKTHSGAGAEALGKNFARAREFIRVNMREGGKLTAEGTALMRSILMKELTEAYGLTQQEARFRVEGKEFSGKTSPGDAGSPKSAPGFHPNAARGMTTFGRPGDRGRDSIPAQIGGHQVMVGSGEIATVMNRSQQAAANAAAAIAGYGSLRGLMEGNSKPHYMAGGGIVGIPWAPGEEIAASILGLVTQLHNRFGVGVSDAFDRDRSAGHQSPGHNVTGTAVDFVGTPAQTDALVQWAVQHGYTTYYDGSFGSTALAGHGPGNHAHVEFGGAGGNVGGIAPVKAARQLERMLVEGPDSLFKNMQQAGMDSIRAQAQSRLEEYVNSQGALGSPMAAGNFGDLAGTGSLSRAQIEGLWIAAGGPPDLAHLMANVAFSESRWNPAAHNASGASGLWQIMMPLHAGLVSQFGTNVFDPLTNAKTAVALYRAAGLSPWAASQSVWGQRNSAPGAATGAMIEAAGGVEIMDDGKVRKPKGKGKPGQFRKTGPGRKRTPERIRSGDAQKRHGRNRIPLLEQYTKATTRSENLRALAGNEETLYMIDEILSAGEQQGLVGRWTNILGTEQSRLALTQRVEDRAGGNLKDARVLWRTQSAWNIGHGRDITARERRADKDERELTGLRKIKKPTKADKTRMERLRNKIMADRKYATGWRKIMLRDTGFEVPTREKLERKGDLRGSMAKTWGQITKARANIADMDELQRPGSIPAEIIDAQVNLARVQAGQPTDPTLDSDTGRSDAMNALLLEQLSTLRTSNRIQAAQLDVFRGFAPSIGRFKHGGPVVEDGLAYLHRGERVLPEVDGPFVNAARRGGGVDGAVHVTLALDQQGLLQIVDQRVAQGAGQVTVATGRQAGRLSRAPGSVPTGPPGR